MIYHDKNCITKCQREQVNKFLQQFLHAKCRVNNFWTALCGNFMRVGGGGGWETGKEPTIPVPFWFFLKTFLGKPIQIDFWCSYDKKSLSKQNIDFLTCKFFYIQNADKTIFKQLSISFLREIEKERGRGAGKQELGVISNENFSLPWFLFCFCLLCGFDKATTTSILLIWTSMRMIIIIVSNS